MMMFRRPSVSINAITFFTKRAPFFSSSSLIDSHSKESKPISSSVNNQLPPTQNPDNIVNFIVNFISSNLKKNRFCLYQLKNKKKMIRSQMGSHEISSILLEYQSDYSSALLFFNWVRDAMHIKPSVQNFCIIIHILTWAKKFPKAMELLNELILLAPDDEDIYENLVACSKDCNWDPAIFNMLIKAYAEAEEAHTVDKVRMVEKGIQTFRKVINASLVPNIHACHCLLSSLYDFDFTDYYWEVFEEMGRLGIESLGHTFKFMTRVLCEDGDIDKVNGFLKQMEAKGYKPDLGTYNLLIDSFCKKRKLQDAFYLYSIMCIRGVIPSLDSYIPLMNGLCEKGMVKEAHQLFNQMVHKGIEPDIVAYNALISGYSKQPEMEMCKSLLHEMKENRIHPDHTTLRLILQVYERDVKLWSSSESATDLLVELHPLGFDWIPTSVYDSVMIKLCENGLPHVARSFLIRISQLHGYQPKVTTYNTLFESLCKFNYVEEALILKNKVINKDITLNDTTSFPCNFEEIMTLKWKVGIKSKMWELAYNLNARANV